MSALPSFDRVLAADVAIRYGRAKSRQDIAAALACCTSDFVLETIPLRTRAEGRDEVEYDLGVFFDQFPDYQFIAAGHAESANEVVLWGHIRMTWSGVLPRGIWRPLDRLVRMRRRTAELPAVAVLTIRDGLIAREQFSFDLPDLARQLGLPAWLLLRLSRRSEERRHAVVDGAPALRVEHSRIIDAPIDAVYERAFADVGRLVAASPAWPLPRARKVELVGAPQLAVGAIRRVHLASGHVTDEEIELVEAPHRVRYRVVNGWGRAIDAFVAATYGEHQLEALYDGRTLVTWRGWIVPRTRLARPIVKLLSAIILSPMFRRYLRAIDHIIREPRVAAGIGTRARAITAV